MCWYYSNIYCCSNCNCIKPTEESSLPVTKYTVTFLVDGETYNTETVDEGNTVNEPSAPTKEGYTFTKWLNNGVAFDFATAITSDLTLTADFDVIEYSITYHNVEGLENQNPTTYTITTETITLQNVSKDGYIFDGWFDNEEFTGETVTEIAKGSKGDKHLYAKFTEDVKAYSIDWNTNKIDGTNTLYDLAKCSTKIIFGTNDKYKEIAEKISSNPYNADEENLGNIKAYFGENEGTYENELYVLSNKLIAFADNDLFYSETLETNCAFFCSCSQANQIVLENIDTTNTTDFSYMFYECSNIGSLNLSCFDSQNVTKSDSMFSLCTTLNTIYANIDFDLTSTQSSTEMFLQCSNLTGGEGTKAKYKSSDNTYAKVDQIQTSGEMGFFTIAPTELILDEETELYKLSQTGLQYYTNMFKVNTKNSKLVNRFYISKDNETGNVALSDYNCAVIQNGESLYITYEEGVISFEPNQTTGLSEFIFKIVLDEDRSQIGDITITSKFVKTAYLSELNFEYTGIEVLYLDPYFVTQSSSNFNFYYNSDADYNVPLALYDDYGNLAYDFGIKQFLLGDNNILELNIDDWSNIPGQDTSLYLRVKD